MSSIEMPYVAVIPYQVLIDQELPPNAKLFYGCLVGLSKKEGYCWATDGQLEEMFFVKGRAIHRWLEVLEKRGYIRRETQNIPSKIEGKCIWEKERKIFINEGFSRKDCEHVKKDSSGHVKKDSSYGHVKKDSSIICINKESLSEKKETSKESEKEEHNPNQEKCLAFLREVIKKHPEIKDKIQFKDREAILDTKHGIKRAEYTIYFKDYIKANIREWFGNHIDQRTL